MLKLTQFRSLAAAATTTVCVLAFAAQAGAADKYRYELEIRPANGPASGQGYVSVYGLNKPQTATVRVLRAAVQQYTGSIAADAQNYIQISTPNLAPGDQIEVQQPTGSVQETFTVPDISITGTPGSQVVSGTVPAGSVAYAEYRPLCDETGNRDDLVDANVQGGAFAAAFPTPVEAGQRLAVNAYPGKGDVIKYSAQLAGETPCFYASAFDDPVGLGSVPSANPYFLYVDDLNPSVAPTSRIVLRRAGTPLVDYSAAGASSISKSTDVKPLPGDVVELYRPQAAGSPSATFTIPGMSAKYDASNQLAAVDAPAASSIDASVGSLYAMWGNRRGALNTAAGRSVFNFGVSQGFEPAVNLAFVDWMSVTWSSMPLHGVYEFNAVPGDLAAPVVGVKLAKSLKLAKIAASVSLTISLNEAASTSIKLTLPAKLKSAAAKKPQTLASAKASFAAGSNKLKLKLSKSGKKLIKKLRRGRYGTQKATLTIVATDSSGNVTTTVKTTKLVKR